MNPDSPPLAPVSDALVRLGDCPPGLFRFQGNLVFKTEYRGMETVGPADIPGSEIRWTVGRHSEVYVVASGEAFWGGATSKDERENLLVEPVECAIPAAPATGGVREALELEVNRWEYASRETRDTPNRRMSLPVTLVCDAIKALATPPIPEQSPAAHRLERDAHGVAWSDDRLGQAYQLIDETYQDWPRESGPGEAIRAAREAVEAADMEIPQ